MNGGFGEIARGVVDLAVGYFGDGLTATLRRRVDLVEAVSGGRLAAFELAEAAAEAAHVVEIVGQLGQFIGGGRVPAGVTLAFEDIAGIYTVASAARVSAGVVRLELVEELAGALDEGALGAFATWAEERTVRVLLADARQEEEAGGVVVARRVYHVAGDDGFAPEKGDVLLDGGAAWLVESVSSSSPAGAAKVARWALSVVGGGG